VKGRLGDEKTQGLRDLKQCNSVIFRVLRGKNNFISMKYENKSSPVYAIPGIMFFFYK
jgi:hypothetical protein